MVCPTYAYLFVVVATAPVTAQLASVPLFLIGPPPPAASVGESNAITAANRTQARFILVTRTTASRGTGPRKIVKLQPFFAVRGEAVCSRGSSCCRFVHAGGCDFLSNSIVANLINT